MAAQMQLCHTFSSSYLLRDNSAMSRPTYLAMKASKSRKALQVVLFLVLFELLSPPPFSLHSTGPVRPKYPRGPALHRYNWKGALCFLAVSSLSTSSP